MSVLTNQDFQFFKDKYLIALFVVKLSKILNNVILVEIYTVVYV